MSATRRATSVYPRNQDHIAHGMIHTLSRLVQGGVVVFASTQSGRGTKHSLALMLLQALARIEPRWQLPRAENTLTLHKSTLGEPYLLLGDQPGPSLSFSHGKGRLWAAMSSKGRVGIDVAYPEEFAADYPFARAFRPEELDRARALCQNDTARGAALIWSAKEASVKAIGTGFNRFDPLDVRVEAPLFKEQGVRFEVLADRPICAWARTEDRGWLCVALA
jgi:phosphopantetheinyl transferase